MSLDNQQNEFYEKREKKYSIAERFSPKIADCKYTTLPIHILQHAEKLGLTWDEAMFSAVVLSYKWTADDPFPAINKMAGQFDGISERTLRYVKNSLVVKGYLRVIPRFKVINGEQTDSPSSNEYDFSGLITAIDKLIPDKDDTRKGL